MLLSTYMTLSSAPRMVGTYIFTYMQFTYIFYNKSIYYYYMI